MEGEVRDMAKVYVIGAAKGGTAKTVSSYNLAYSLAEKGKKVLAVDAALCAEGRQDRRG